MYEEAVKTYQQTNLFTADPMRLVLMCYEGAISSLKLARERYAAKDYEAKGRAVQKALDIIHELNASLDMEKGGDISVNLRALYLYMTQALVEADLKKDLGTFGKIISMLEELEAEWKTVFTRRFRNVQPVGDRVPPVARQPLVASRAWSA